MKRKVTLVLAAIVAMIAVALLAMQKKPDLLLLDWAAKADAEKTPVAVLLEMGLKDAKATVWSGHITVNGAKVVHREGYRFQAEDKLTDPDGWKATTRFPGTARPIPVNAKFATVGVVLHLDDIKDGASLTINAGDDLAETKVALKDVLAGEHAKLWDGKAVLRRVSTATPVVTAKTEDDFPAAAYGPDGTLWLAYISYTLKDENRRFNYMQIKEQPKDFKAFYTPEFGDQLFVKSYKGGKWSEPIAVTDPKQDLVRCAIAVEGNGNVVVAYSANREGNYDIYARPIEEGRKLGTEQRLTKQPGPDLGPVMCTDQAGNVHLAYQSWNEKGSATIALLSCHNGKWEDGPTLPGAKVGENRWCPALAAGPGGQVAVAYDVYKDGDYDVHVAVINGKDVKDYAVADSPLFEARPSVVYDTQGRLWIAYEEGPEKWGKNFGALETDRGHPLYGVRSVRVACLVDGKLFKPAAELPTSKQNNPRAQPNQNTPRYAYPKLGLDGKGRLWLTYRDKQGSPFGKQPGTDWLTMARRLDGDKWTEPLELHRSDGLLDSRPVLLPHPGGSLLVLTNTDGRFATPGTLDNQIYASVVDLPGEPVAPKLVAVETKAKPDNKDEAEELVAVKRMREYRLEVAGKKYQLERGEFHRHTEISFDGGNDGSLEDMWRYAIDAAKLDWISCTDHDNGNGKEYTWWQTQKYTDAYHAGNAFTPIFGYERSVQYPMGHRNLLFVRRGIRTLPRLHEADKDKAAVGNIHVDDTKMLYRYLKELDGICASHTSATSMGTDWRDNDPVVEPVVEIYQGDRNNYEKEAAPRAGYKPGSGMKPENIAGWYPKGYINLALSEKGYRFGFQSSSDHISTHISYCVALAEAPGREGVIAALKKRHCYAATEDIVVEVKSGTHLMGDEFKTTAAPKLEIKVVGAKPLARVDVLKDSDVVETFKPGKREYSGTWTDPKPDKGVHYYYIRIEQEDGELAWASPMYIDYAP